MASYEYCDGRYCVCGPRWRFITTAFQNEALLLAFPQVRFFFFSLLFLLFFFFTTGHIDSVAAGGKSWLGKRNL